MTTNRDRRPRWWRRLKGETIPDVVTIQLPARHVGVIALALEDRIQKTIERDGIDSPAYNAAMQAREAIADIQVDLAYERRP